MADKRPPGRSDRAVRTWARQLCRLLAGGLLAAAVLAATALPVRALDPQDRVDVGQAFQAAARGEWERVWRLVAPVADPLPAKTLRWLRMLEDGEPADFGTFARFLMANPDWPYPERLQVKAEELIRDPADHALIRTFFADRPPLTTRGRIRYAQALFQVGQDEAATALIRQAWVEGDFSAREDKRFFSQYRRYLREQDHIDRLDSLLWDQRQTAAGRMLGRVPDGYRRLAQARMALQRRAGGVDRAIEAVPAALRDDPGLALDRLRWRRKSRMFDGVLAILLNPPAELGRPDRWWYERVLEIRRSLRERDFERAYRLAASHRQTEGLDFAEATWLWGWLALRHANRPDEAFRRFIEMYEAVSSPTNRGRAAYWAGRSAAALGDHALARTWYQAAAQQRVSYYGQLAALELGTPPAPVRATEPRVEERTAFEAREIVQVARMLVEVGADQWLRPFALYLVGQAASPAEVGMAADLIAASGRADLVALSARAAAYRGQVNEIAAFPIPDLDGLLASTDGDPEPALLLAVVRQESGFNTMGQSHAGARGLLQLMPRTAHLMARKLDMPFNHTRLTADPDYNLRLGRHYLRTLLERYDGEVALAMSAYNAGPRRVDQWIALNGDPRHGTPHDLVDWVELIPFEETRNYVQRVLEGRNLYRQRLAASEAVRIPFRHVAGPIRPIPRPHLKPIESDPVAPPGRAAGILQMPDDGPPGSFTELADATPNGAPGTIARPGQTVAAPSRIPQARPASASLDEATRGLSGRVVWPEPKPDRRHAIEAANPRPPQPELKPAGP